MVEVMIAVALLMVVAIGSLSANSLATGTIVINQQRSRANFLAREAMEALMSVRAKSFTSLAAGGFHPVMTEDGWTLTPGIETIGEFTRIITLSNVMRQLSCDEEVCAIVEGGGVFDEGTMKARVTVTWNEVGRDKSYFYDTLITYWR
ncbi:MAG: hypothetical protein UW35_C0010G0016 [Candidatus Collierbacteria bacterium GW2011_GWF2_44_15]|uniref:Uncharacterized protein n=4 Tax=Candidatus Collieribacteriota TaxID=1752725 RepID=A0A0G1KFP0_9BACT|nr:MAG: hypothetical protein UW26_C0006G0009 [Candidatus Collierbacteria bacterium GW2011_GWF1_44_12]KKT46659.1 MAG: hypothetical protein UW35_C0010G0016 [Candidatus Collierbacteria bacterium GW2011_GWF2_44_15]KKU00315.1 MAG: hypothetical protein UW99_C0002G0017 [Candidatus Collierbacteria bacterium GW2011_GWC2_45_15]KKU30463.1 MAG: hypothetical protein UX41_C0003G0016 [Candidatus Collierbacteria bacterium GW2011_GWE1_46_18]